MCPSENGENAVGKFILIGDHKQLPAVVLQNTEQSEIYDEGLRSAGLKNLKDSLFERLYRTLQTSSEDLFPDSASVSAPNHRSFDMLCKQGRMHPEVAHFANQAFYEGRLLPVGLPHQMEDNQDVQRMVFYLPNPNLKVHRPKSTIPKHGSSPESQPTFTSNMVEHSTECVLWVSLLPIGVRSH